VVPACEERRKLVVVVVVAGYRIHHIDVDILPDEVVLVWWRQQPILQYLRSGIYLSQPRALTSELKTCFGILLLAAQRVSAVQRQARGRGHGRLDRFRRPPTLHLSWQDDYGWIAWPQSGFRQSIKARIFTTISR